jgi:hypothetical protein
MFDMLAADILPVPTLNQFDIVNLAMKKVGQLKRQDGLLPPLKKNESVKKIAQMFA